MAIRIVRRLKNHQDYIGAIFSGYALMGMNIIAQIFLVPLYLQSLGKYEFGVLMILLSLLNYAAVGIGWMSGGMLRMMTEYATLKDYDGFVKIYVLGKFIYVMYAFMVGSIMVIASIWIGDIFFKDMTVYTRETVQMSIVASAIYFVVQYDLSVDRIALSAIGKQTSGNIFQMLSVGLFTLSVIPWLLIGGGLKGVMLCLIGGVLGARVASWLYWRHIGVRIGWYWPNSETLPLLRRLIGPMGLGYMLYGAIFLTMQTDSMIVGWLGGAGAAAEFILVWKAADILVQVIWRIPEYSQPYLIQLDARGEKERLRDGCQEALRWIVLVSVVIGICYALFGPWVLRVWVGHENAIENPLAFFLAGGAIFWLGAARLPAVFAYATIRLKRLIKIVSIELIGKVILTFLFFPKIGYIAPLAAINVMHAAGIFLMYRRVIK